ncbi:MAG TPA: Slp family lipoprotein [Deltaproteobacteria bacterium]|jgi:outer membrane lipoprotein|nr:Slp family lipoprotein [Deltaproteobacteria bacterium]HQI01775.1 Slp family lipoprotein [Deltaproteobacteria bacterium]
MKRQRYLLAAVLAAAVAAVCPGCAGPISNGVIKNADESVTLDRVRANPGAYEGRVVLWTGIILDTQPLENSTVIEILERPADRQKRPKNVDASRGRFFARGNGFLDPAVLCQGREITVVGKIAGSESSLIGEYNYTYPVVDIEEYHLWAPEREIYYYTPYPPYPFYDPWWFY